MSMQFTKNKFFPKMILSIPLNSRLMRYTCMISYDGGPVVFKFADLATSNEILGGGTLWQGALINKT